MLKLKFQYFGHLMWRTDSLEKTLMLGKNEGRRRMEQQRMRWLEGITTRWTWAWASSGSWWWTGRPGVLHSMVSQRVGNNWESELNWNDLIYKVKVKVTQVCPTLCDPMNYTVYGILQVRILGWEPFPSPGDLPSQAITPRSPALQADSLPAEPQGKPKNTGVGSLSLLQQIFLTQESNWGLLHCRWILYQLSNQGSPFDL